MNVYLDASELKIVDTEDDRVVLIFEEESTYGDSASSFSNVTAGRADLGRWAKEILKHLEARK